MNMEVYGLIYFYENRYEIVEMYDNMSQKEKWLFKKEIYSMPFEKEYVKDLIWEYIQGYDDMLLWLEYKKRVDRINKQCYIKFAIKYCTIAFF